jgi:type III secretory pathway component EscU
MIRVIGVSMTDVIIFLWTLGILVVLGVIAYAWDDLHQRQVALKKDDLDRELRELIGGDK